jgi:hypothetical protein
MVGGLGAVLHGIVQWGPNKIGKLIGLPGDTSPLSARNALSRKHVNLGAPCTGGN